MTDSVELPLDKLVREEVSVFIMEHKGWNAAVAMNTWS